MADWEQLNTLATQYLANAALQAQRNRHDMAVTELNHAVNQHDYLMRDLNNKQQELVNVANADEVSRIAFDSLDEKYKTAGTSNLVHTFNKLDIESLNNEITNLSAEIQNVQDAKIALGKTITDISEAKTLFEEQASLIGTGDDRMFDAGDLDKLISDLPKITDGDETRYITIEDLNEAMLDGVTSEELNMFDFDQSGFLDENDAAILKNVETMIEKRAGIDAYADAENVYADTMERMKSISEINALNQMLVLGYKADLIDYDEIKEQRLSAEENVSNKYNELFNSVLSTDEDTGTTDLNENILADIENAISDPNSAIYVANEADREDAATIFQNRILSLLTTDSKSFKERFEILKQDVSFQYLAQAMEEEFVNSISPLLYEFNQYYDEFDVWTDLYHQRGGPKLPSKQRNNAYAIEVDTDESSLDLLEYLLGE